MPGVARSRISACDIDPKNDGIKKQDYLKTKKRYSKKRVVIGNPPFGSRGKLALEFLNKALTEAPIVAMIFPNTFNRFLIHGSVNKSAKLIHSQPLRENAFIHDDREYRVKCVFQIWSSNYLTYARNLRITNRPPFRHPDFTTWIHNNTEETRKYFNKKKYNWDFAVVRQGYYDYDDKIFSPSKLISNRQYFFVKANSEDARKIIDKIDFKKLALSNTQVLGFSTTDFVAEYIKIKEKDVI